MGTIELDGLEVRLGNRTILSGPTGVLREQAVCPLGPKGAGKSTLIDMLSGFRGVERDSPTGWRDFYKRRKGGSESRAAV